MRIYKFRGKAKATIEELNENWIKHNNGWVYGNLITNGGHPYIVGDIVDSADDYIAHEFWVPVHPESVGQCIGLKDKNSVEIYAGDKFNLGEPNIAYTVIWVDAGFKGKQDRSSSYVGLYHWRERIEVIGNIYDNPELLEP